MTREEIKSYLNDGDGVRISLRCAAKGTPTTNRYVMQVVNGKNKANDKNKAIKGTAKIIMEEALIVALENKNIIEQAKINK